MVEAFAAAMDETQREFTRLWTAHLSKVSAFVASMVHDFTDREDVLQDCAVAAMTSFARYDPARPFAAWVIGVARNQIRLYLRRKSKDPHVFDSEALEALVQAFSTLDTAELRKLDRLEFCVNRLEGRARRLCEYRYARNLKPMAIAGKMGMTPNTVAKALQRMREQLRACMDRPPTHA